MKIMHKTKNLSNKVVKVEITNETKCFVTECGSNRRRGKVGEHESYFDTFDDAKDSLIKSAKSKVEAAEICLNHAKRKLHEAMNITED